MFAWLCFTGNLWTGFKHTDETTYLWYFKAGGTEFAAAPSPLKQTFTPFQIFTVLNLEADSAGLISV